jgi:hypothetical protein
MRTRRILLNTSIVTGMVAAGVPATAHDPDHDHAGPGSSGPDTFLLSRRTRAGARKRSHLDPQPKESVLDR